MSPPLTPPTLPPIHSPPPQLETELSTTNENLSVATEQLDMQALEIDELREALNLQGDISDATPVTPDVDVTAEMEQIITMLEEERAELANLLKVTYEELADHEVALKNSQTALNESETKLSIAQENLAIMSPRQQDCDDNTITSNVSSLASFVTADGNPLSPGLTPRSERESEDMIAYFEGVVKGLKEENSSIKERAKKERRRRKEAEEVFAAKLGLKEDELRERDDEVDAVKGELKRMQSLVSKSNALVEQLRGEKIATVQRTKAVVMGSNSMENSRENSRESSRERGEGERGREAIRAWNNSPQNCPGLANVTEDKGVAVDKEVGMERLPPPLPSGEPPKRRPSHDRQWLNNKLREMGVRGGEGGKRRGSKNRILPQVGITPDVGTEERERKEKKKSAAAQQAAQQQDVDNFWMRKSSGSSQGKVTTKGARVGLGTDIFTDV